jgi:hypothetical protein
MLHWCCMFGRITTTLVLFHMIANLCFIGVVCLSGLQLFLYCSLWLIIYASLVLHVWSDCDYFCTVPYNWYFMLHWCCMSGRIASIFVLFSMTDNLFFIGVVCLVGLRLLLYCSLWLIIYFSLVLYCLVGWRLLLYCSLYLIIYASCMLYVRFHRWSIRM